MLAIFCNAFLIRFSDFRHGILLKFAGTVFSRSPLLQATDDIFSRHTAFVCGGNPCSEGLLSHVQFLVTVPNLQAGAHGILDPPCATKLRSWMGYQGWSPWRTCSWSRCSFIIQAFWWLSGYYFVICMNNSRNRSPLRIFQYLPISATFVQCGQRRPSWTKHVNSKISSGALSGMKRLIDEIRSFKCVFGRESVMVLSWSGNCRRVNSIPLIWLRPSTFSPPKMGVCLVLVQRKTTRQYHWVVLTMNRSHRYFFEPYPIWFGTNFPFRPLEMSNSCYGVPLSNGDRRSPWKLSCMFPQALKNLWKISENLWLHFVPLNYSDSLWFTLNIRGYSWTKAFGPSSETTMSRQKNKAEETAIEHLDLLVGRISESFDAVFSRYFSFQFLYRHPGSTDMFFTFIHEANHWKRITRWYLYSWPFLIVCCHGVPFSIFDT